MHFSRCVSINHVARQATQQQALACLAQCKSSLNNPLHRLFSNLPDQILCHPCTPHVVCQSTMWLGKQLNSKLLHAWRSAISLNNPLHRLFSNLPDQILCHPCTPHVVCQSTMRLGNQLNIKLLHAWRSAISLNNPLHSLFSNLPDQILCHPCTPHLVCQLNYVARHPDVVGVNQLCHHVSSAFSANSPTSSSGMLDAVLSA